MRQHYGKAVKKRSSLDQLFLLTLKSFKTERSSAILLLISALSAFQKSGSIDCRPLCRQWVLSAYLPVHTQAKIVQLRSRNGWQIWRNAPSSSQSTWPANAKWFKKCSLTIFLVVRWIWSFLWLISGWANIQSQWKRRLLSSGPTWDFN